MISANKILLVAIVAIVFATNQVEFSKGERDPVYTRLSDDLKALAQKDVDTVIQLETLKKKGQNEAWSSSFLKFVDKYVIAKCGLVQNGLPKGLVLSLRPVY